VTVEAGPKVRLRLSAAQQERALAGDILRFTVALPDGPRLIHLQRNDVAPAEPAPAFRLRVMPTLFSDLRLGAITPLFSDVPFTLELSLASPAEVARNGEDPSIAAGGTLFAGIFMLGMGALRAALASRPDSTNTFMMLIGGGMLVYGGWRWLAPRFSR